MNVSPAKALEQYRRTALRTARVVRCFDDADLSITPGPGSMTTAQQINHICASSNFTRELLSEMMPSMEAFRRTFDTSTVEACLNSIRGIMVEVEAAATRVTPQMWQEQLEPFGPGYIMTRGEWVWEMVSHEVHHSGQLHVYLRVAGKSAPMLYHPVDESVFQLEKAGSAN